MAKDNNIIIDIWNSFRAMPGAVQAWVGLVLVPVNFASLLFLNQQSGIWVAFLALVAIMVNLPVMLWDRGFSKLMALPHLVPWTILVFWLVFAPPTGSGSYEAYMWVLLIVDGISLGFDYPDAIKWLNGDRKPAGR